MQHSTRPGGRIRALAGLVAGLMLTVAQVAAADDKAVRLAGLLALTILAATQPAAGHTAAGPAKASPYRPGTPSSASSYYQSVWGVDNFLVRSTASGSLIRFSYRVVDPARAEVLGDARATPKLVDPQRGVELQVPTLEKVGELRQKGKPVAGNEYWMVFSNKGLPVRVGDRVNVVIGDFRAEGLVVE